MCGSKNLKNIFNYSSNISYTVTSPGPHYFLLLIVITTSWTWCLNKLPNGISMSSVLSHHKHTSIWSPWLVSQVLIRVYINQSSKNCFYGSVNSLLFPLEKILTTTLLITDITFLTLGDLIPLHHTNDSSLVQYTKEVGISRVVNVPTSFVS